MISCCTGSLRIKTRRSRGLSRSYRAGAKGSALFLLPRSIALADFQFYSSPPPILHICVPTTFLLVIACASFLPETHGSSILGAARWQAEIAVTMMSPWLPEVKEIALLRARDARLAEQLRYQSCLNQAVLQAWYPVVRLQH